MALAWVSLLVRDGPAGAQGVEDAQAVEAQPAASAQTVRHVDQDAARGPAGFAQLGRGGHSGSGVGSAASPQIRMR
jgi:hypothetical protein